MDSGTMSKYSHRSLKVRVLDTSGAPLGEATGFLCLRGARTYLVTNLHVVSRHHLRNANNYGHVSPLRIPWTLELIFPTTSQARHSVKIQVPLYDAISRQSNGLATPLFEFENPLFTDTLKDVALTPVDVDAIVDWKAKRAVETHRYRDTSKVEPPLHVTDSVFIVGYPQNSGMAVGAPPVWTRGSIATEPNTASGRSYLLVDARTRPGQSGSPVIQYRRAVTHATEGGFSETFPERARLIGIYSGRTDEDSDLGRVWSITALRLG